MRDFKSKKTLRKAQVDACNNVFDLFESGKNRLLMVAPTGVGKTSTMGSIANYYLARNPNDIVLIISHLSLLVTQSGDSFMEFFGLKTDVLQADRMPHPDSRCVLSTIQSCSSVAKIYQWMSRTHRKVGLILVDEAHRNTGTTTSNKVLKEYFPNAKVVGFTGSPFRNNRDMSWLYEAIAFSMSLNEAIKAGYLVNPTLHGMSVDKKNIDHIYESCTRIIKTYHLNDQSVVFLKTIDDAIKYSQYLNTIGISSSPIVSSMSNEERDEILKKFRIRTKDSPSVLVTVDVLSVGFDAPQLMAVIMPYGTGSVSTYLQRIGRGLRTFGSKHTCHIYIGGKDPKVEAERWEETNRKAMNAGKRSKDIIEDIELNSGLMTETERKDIIAQIKLYKKLNTAGMDTLAEMVRHREFPQELLGNLVVPTKIHSNKTKPSDAQINLINRSTKIDPSNLNKNEASAVINAVASKNGWSNNVESVPSGKFKGQKATEVPWSYISLVSKRGKYYNAELHEFFKKTRGAK